MAIGVNLQKLISSWNIRFMMIVSLSVQIVLAFAALYRRNTSGSLTAIIVWSTYLLSDWAAIYTFGLIFNTVRASSVTPSEVNQGVLALWASFLLIHMGGPDTITAYSLEDNNLWLRHLIRLVGQLAIFSYIFLKSFPGNNLLVPTILVLSTGVLKYGERTRALFLASLDNLKGSLGKQPTNSQGIFLGKFTCLIIDVMPSPSELEESRKHFMEVHHYRALQEISTELKRIYNRLYTKIRAIADKWGIYTRGTVYVTMATSLVLFCQSSKSHFDAVDVRITYCLLVGVFVVDLSRAIISFESSFFQIDPSMGGCAALVDIAPQLLMHIPGMIFCFISECFGVDATESWSRNIGRFNMLDCSIQKYCRYRGKSQYSLTPFFDKAIDICGLTDRVDKMKYAGWNHLEGKIWKFIFDEVKQKAEEIMNEKQAKVVFESKGEFVLKEMHLDELKKNYVEEFDYDKGILCWHIATEICYNNDEDEREGDREWSKTLSDYLMYLLIYRPKLTANMIGIGHERYAQTCLEVMELAQELKVVNAKDFCEKVLKDNRAGDPEKGGGGNEHQEEGKEGRNQGGAVRDKSVLQDGRDLARELMSNKDKWKITGKVWVEKLLYTAGHCRGAAHARMLSEGGELATHVWFLMAVFGIAERWSKN